MRKKKFLPNRHLTFNNSGKKRGRRRMGEITQKLPKIGPSARTFVGERMTKKPNQ